MPRRNGTGPRGLGPGTGRGRGWCRGLLFPGGRFSSTKAGFLGALVSLAGVLIREAMKPDGLLRSCTRRLLDQRRAARDAGGVPAEYTVIDESPSEGIEENSKE